MSNDRLPVDSKEWLYRRSYFNPEKNYLNPDGTATSRVFKLREKDNGELSVDVKSLTTPANSIGDASKFILFEILNQSVLDQDLSTLHAPCTTETHGFENPSHAVIVGMDMKDDVKPGLLARKARKVHF